MKTHSAPRNKRAIGREMEELATQFLCQNGLKIVARNYQITGGELDLVMRDTQSLVFVEVRYRSRSNFGGALETITATKRHRIIRTAEHFLLKHGQFSTMPCRFDVLAIQGTTPGSIDYHWIPNAFESF